MAGSFDCGTLSFELADERSDADLRALLQDNPMDSWVRVSLAREPSFFLAQSLWPHSLVVIARDRASGNRAAGMYDVGALPIHINGCIKTAGYLGGLRIGRDYRNKIRFVRTGFDSIAVLGEAVTAGLDCWFTSIAQDNVAATRLLTAGVPRLPRYLDVGAMQTLAISTRQGIRRDLLRPATPQDIPDLVSFYNRHAAQYNYSPVLTESWLTALSQTLAVENFLLLIRDQNIHGCLALWDQRSMKQTVIEGYRFPLNLCRLPYNMYAHLRRSVTLPAPGQSIASAFLAFFALDAEYRQLAVQVVKDALSRLPKEVDTALIGLSTANPLGARLLRAVRPQVYASRIYAVEFSPNTAEPAGHPAQPEIALL